MQPYLNLTRLFMQKKSTQIFFPTQIFFRPKFFFRPNFFFRPKFFSDALSQEKPTAENPLNPSGHPAEDKPDGEEVQIELELTGQRRFSNRSKYSQNKRGRGTPKTDRSIEPKQVVKDQEVELLEVESGKVTTHPEKGPADRSVEGDKQLILARDQGTNKKTLQHNESVRGGQRSVSKKVSRKKADFKSKGTGQGIGDVPANPAAGPSSQSVPYLQSGVCPLDHPGMWRCRSFSCRGRNWPTVRGIWEQLC